MLRNSGEVESQLDAWTLPGRYDCHHHN